MSSSSTLDDEVKRVAVVGLKVQKLINLWLVRQCLLRDER